VIVLEHHLSSISAILMMRNKNSSRLKGNTWMGLHLGKKLDYHWKDIMDSVTVRKYFHLWTHNKLFLIWSWGKLYFFFMCPEGGILQIQLI